MAEEVFDNPIDRVHDDERGEVLDAHEPRPGASDGSPDWSSYGCSAV